MVPAKTIVYVEDDLDDQQLMRHAFAERSDHTLQILANSVDLFSYLRRESEQVCLLVLDINLPYRNGIEILRELKKTPIYAHLPVLIFTTGVNSPQAKELSNMDVEVIEKPSTFQELQTIADRIVQHCLHTST